MFVDCRINTKAQSHAIVHLSIFKQMMNDDVLCCSKPRTVETNRQIDIGNSNRENAAIAIKRKSTSTIRAKNKRARRKVPNDVKSIDTASNSDSLLPKLELDKTKLSTSTICLKDEQCSCLKTKSNPKRSEHSVNSGKYKSTSS